MADNQKHTDDLWDSLWLNARLATMVDGYGETDANALAIKDGKIAWIGHVDALPSMAEHLARHVHDADNLLLTPGLIDCHTHLVYAGNRAHEFEARLNGKSYTEIAQAGGGILSTVRATRAASEEELFAQSAKRLKSFLAEGVTTMEIKSGYGLDLENELKMLRVARQLGNIYPISIATSFLGAHALPPEFTGDADGYINHLCDIMPHIAESGLADAVDGFCETIGFTPAHITQLFDCAAKHGLRVKLHAEQLSDQGGAELAARYRALSADHLEHASASGIAAMAAAGTVAVLLPGAFHMLRETKQPPIALLRQHGVPMALASDANPGTSPVGSLLLMLNMGCVLFGLTPLEALTGVTRHAAQALGLSDAVGTLEVGKTADIALWDVARPGELSYAIGYNPCRGIIRHGIYHDTRNI